MRGTLNIRVNPTTISGSPVAFFIRALLTFPDTPAVLLDFDHRDAFAPLVQLAFISSPIIIEYIVPLSDANDGEGGPGSGTPSGRVRMDFIVNSTTDDVCTVGSGFATLEEI